MKKMSAKTGSTSSSNSSGAGSDYLSVSGEANNNDEDDEVYEMNDEQMTRTSMTNEHETRAALLKLRREESNLRSIKEQLMPDMVRSVKEMRELMTSSEQAVRHLTDSLRHMDRTVERVEEPTRAFIELVERLQNTFANAETTVPYLDELCEVMRLVDSDRLKIKQGPKTSIGEYIEKLAKIKRFERFAWINSIEYKLKDVFNREKTIKSHYNEYMDIMTRGEKILVQEFVGKCYLFFCYRNTLYITP